MMLLGLLAGLSALAWAWLLIRHGGFFGGFWRIEPVLNAPSPAVWPSVVAVVPARNEAEVIADSVQSLLRQDYPGPFRVVLVDDNSSDGTGEIARNAAALINASDRLTVLSGQPLPSGWVGKVWAMSQGVAAADESTPDYLLFTDADIRHGVRVVRTLVAGAETLRLDLSSLMVRLAMLSGAEKAVIPAFVYFFRLLYPFREVARPTSPVAGAAGGCMLVRRPALARIGDMAAIKAALIDDCSLARAIKSSGGRLALNLTADSDSIRPYPHASDLWMMIARSAYTQLEHSPWLLAGSLLGLAIGFLVPPLAVVTGLIGHHHHGMLIAGLAAWIMMGVTYLPMVRYYRRSPLWAVALPFTALFYMGATADSGRRHWLGRGGVWKGRVQASGSKTP